MTDIGFAPKKVITPEVCRLEILEAHKSDTYGPQLSLSLKVIGGVHNGHRFNDYSSRDEHTGDVKEDSKAWSIFEACLGRDFYKKPDVTLESLVGKQFMAQVTQTKTGSRNKVEFGTVRPVPPEEESGAAKPDNPSGNDDDNMFADISF